MVKDSEKAGVDLAVPVVKGGANTERWHFDENRDNNVHDTTEYEGENIYGTILDSHGDLHIARIWADGPDPEGHARLISLAPELLEALREMDKATINFSVHLLDKGILITTELAAASNRASDLLARLATGTDSERSTVK